MGPEKSGMLGNPIPDRPPVLCAHAGRWKHPGTEKWEGALYAEAVRCMLLVGREIKTEIPASRVKWDGAC